MFRMVKMLGFWIMMKVVIAGAAVAQSDQIQSTISQQIEAFETDDFEAAFGFASPTLRRLFQTPEHFQRMVTGGYPMVWRPAEVRFLELSDVDGTLWQKVMITDQDGVVHILGYRMLETDMGWKINGVQLLPMPDVSA